MSNGRRPLLLAAALALFGVLATANAGGYRYGVSDQAFYIPALALEAHPDLFPRDRSLLAPQMRLWPGAGTLEAASTAFGGDPSTGFLVLYVLTLALLGMGGLLLVRALGGSWWAAGSVLALLTLRHRIAKTGANSLEGYMHPRMLAFAIGVCACAALVRNRWGLAVGLVFAAAWIHPTTGAWFGAMLVLAAIWQVRSRAVLGAAIAAGVTATVGIAALAASGRLVRMDPAWLGVLEGKDYLFPAEWPAYAWLANLAYPLLILLLHGARRRRGLTTTGEDAVVAGALGLAAGFLLSVPLAEMRVAFVVQLQVNRVFWLLDVLVAAYVAWWFADVLARRRPALVLGLLVLAAAARGTYILAVEARRPLVQVRMAPGAWRDAMAWLSAQPAAWQVLADPGHAWKFGTSVRVAALRDTVLESGKDSAMAMYDRDVAMRVADRTRALADFDTMSAADVRRLDAAYGVDVFVDRADRTFPFPVLYRTRDFVIYDLR